jgi:murein DD-endopeptidase MepM/ murein hydrolase activator NlpD
VALVRDCFFSGKSVVIDHGSGIYSMYFHLSEYKVQPGDYVEKGQVIGQAGMTGRSTAPHLHWGFRLSGARVSPDSIMALAPLLDKLQ